MPASVSRLVFDLTRPRRPGRGCASPSSFRRRRRSALVQHFDYLAGLICTEATFPIKADVQNLAAEHGLVLVAPDTSLCGANLAGEGDDRDFGTRAGFYLDATAAQWSSHYCMARLVTQELLRRVGTNFPARFDGRPWRAGDRTARSGAMALRLGLCADRQTGGGAEGRKSVLRLSRSGSLSLGRMGCQPADASATLILA